MYDLNSILINGTGWALGGAYGINDAGQITLYGDNAGQRHALLLTPVADTSSVPEPSTWLACTLGLAGVAWRARRRV